MSLKNLLDNSQYFLGSCNNVYLTCNSGPDALFFFGGGFLFAL